MAHVPLGPVGRGVRLEHGLGLPDRRELPALGLHQVQGVRHDPVLGRVPEGHALGLEELQHFVLDILVSAVLHHFSQLLHELGVGDFIMNKRATILYTTLHDLLTTRKVI